MNRKSIFAASLISLIVLSCGNNTNYLPIKKVSDIIAEMQLAEAFASINPATLDSTQQYFKGKNLDTLERYYKIVLQRNNITKEKFSASFSHYAKDPELLDSMLRTAEKAILVLEKKDSMNKKAVVDTTAR